MSAKVSDRFFLFLAIILVSPLFIAALIYVAIAYPLHLITSVIFPKIRTSYKK